MTAAPLLEMSDERLDGPKCRVVVEWNQQGNTWGRGGPQPEIQHSKVTDMLSRETIEAYRRMTSLENRRNYPMATERSLDIARRATEFYEQHLRDELEATHRNAFVAVEPDSGQYFLGNTLSEAIQAARAAYPDRISFALRVGHPSAVNLGVMST